MKVKESENHSACPTLCDPMAYTVHGILQARMLEWVAFPSPEDLPNPGIESRSPTFQADSLPAEPQGKPRQTVVLITMVTVLHFIPLTYSRCNCTCVHFDPLCSFHSPYPQLWQPAICSLCLMRVLPLPLQPISMLKKRLKVTTDLNAKGGFLGQFLYYQ